MWSWCRTRGGPLLTWIFSAALLAVAGTGCSVVLPADETPMVIGAAAIPPYGFIGFCLKYADECRLGAAPAAVVSLTAARRLDLDEVQDRVNRAVKPRQEPANVWDFPNDGYGDCNRYALEKQHELIARGWPRAALLLTVAVTGGNEGHLVLVARTDQGDLVLDNLRASVVDWASLPYRWISRQSGTDHAQWVTIVGAPRLAANPRAAGAVAAQL
jgi:predicted transglutaminase-like cysteine proteinase